MSDADATSEARAPTWLYVLELGYVAALVGLAVLYGNWHWLSRLVHDQVGPVPLAVPWWGAIGGTTISLTGIFRNATSWKSSYERWHIARPLLGAIVGTVGYLIFIIAVRTTGAQVQPRDATAQATADVVAFLVGYREDLFRDLLKTATTFLFKGKSTRNRTVATSNEAIPTTDSAG